MPDAGRQIWKIRVLKKNVELTLSEDKNEQEQTKNAEKGTKRKIENQRKRNEKTMKNDLSWNDPWSDHPETQFGFCLSFLSEPWTQTYIAYLKSPFWLNPDTWTEEVFP